MPRKCAVCFHPARDEIEMLINNDESNEEKKLKISEVCRTYNITRDAYYWHSKNHGHHITSSNSTLELQSQLDDAVQKLAQSNERERLLAADNFKLRQTVASLKNDKLRILPQNMNDTLKREYALNALHFSTMPNSELLKSRRNEYAKLFHADKSGVQDSRMAIVNEAYAILKNSLEGKASS